jgi:hypothetical protein
MVPDEHETLKSEILSKPPEDISWRRYILSGNTNQILLCPIAPNRPVVVCPESKLKIESGAQALFYVLFPLWINILVGTDQEHVLSDQPTRENSCIPTMENNSNLLD